MFQLNNTLHSIRVGIASQQIDDNKTISAYLCVKHVLRSHYLQRTGSQHGRRDFHRRICREATQS
jgi:hypothetical protein